MITVRQRQEERRQEKLREVQRQIRRGSLIVRKMTSAEQAMAAASRRAKTRP
jgi:hypothetical protein